MKKPLTNEHGEVRKLTDEDVRNMRPLSEALPLSLQRAIFSRYTAADTSITSHQVVRIARQGHSQ